MISTESSPAGIGRPELDDEFEALRAAYHERMRSDRERLVVIHTELRHGHADLIPVYRDIRLLAHRIGGAAAIFEVPSIARQAAALERCALQAIEINTDEIRGSIRCALDQLLGSLPSPYT